MTIQCRVSYYFCLSYSAMCHSKTMNNEYGATLTKNHIELFDQMDHDAPDSTSYDE